MASGTTKWNQKEAVQDCELIAIYHLISNLQETNTASSFIQHLEEQEVEQGFKTKFKLET